MFRRECHLSSVISQETDDGGKDEHHYEIDRMDPMQGDSGAHTVPEDKDDLEEEKKERKLNLSFDIIDGF